MLLNIMLGSLITSKTRLRMLIKFFISAANNGYLNGLANEFNESTNSIRKELNNLSNAGYLLKSKENNRIIYNANTSHPMFEVLQKIVRQHLGLEDIVETVIERIGDVDQIALTGEYVIKANFPARIAFRVTSKIDSRTILDGSGADQLIGRGDMLFTQGNELIRIQCAFVDTPEIELLTDFIGSQKAYATAHQLPEYIGEEGGTNLDIDIEDRDKLFREAAEVLVTAQQGSASLLQRKLKLGYNRAGRLIDQLEAAGIVGPFEGSKARQVLIPDLQSLDRHLENE